MIDRGTRNTLDGEIVELRKGLHIYKVKASPFWRVRIRNPRTKKYIVRSTKEVGKLQARQVAEEFYNGIISQIIPLSVPREFTVEFFYDQIVKDAQYEVSRGTRPPRYVENTKFAFTHKRWGLLKELGSRDVREIETKDYVAYIQKVREADPTLSGKTFTAILTAFRKVMTQALLSGVIKNIPQTPRVKSAKKDVPRTFFRFQPLVSKEDDEYKRLLRGATELQGTVVRGTEITEEFRDIIMFAVHAFVRPTYSELYALKHKDVTPRNDSNRNEKWLLLEIAKGKTGRRLTDTMPGAATVYQRIQKRYPNATAEDYLFLPNYSNRPYAARVFRQQFNHLLKVTGLKKDSNGRSHQVYDLRHTGLAMRTLRSKGKADLLILAQNAGTSIDMLERFYLQNLPRSKEAIANLHSFGE